MFFCGFHIGYHLHVPAVAITLVLCSVAEETTFLSVVNKMLNEETGKCTI